MPSRRSRSVREIGDPSVEAYAQVFFAEALQVDPAGWEAAVEQFDHAIRLADVQGSRRAVISALSRLSALHRRRGDTAAALQAARQAVDLARQGSDVWLLAFSQFHLGLRARRG